MYLIISIIFLDSTRFINFWLQFRAAWECEFIMFAERGSWCFLGFLLLFVLLDLIYVDCWRDFWPLAGLEEV
jgi:hypothetical protein